MNKSSLIVLSVLVLIQFGTAGFFTDPSASVANTGSSIILHKELSGYRNYGVADHASDILYSGNSGSWSFNLSSLGIDLGAYGSAKVTASLVLDDHYYVPTSAYSLDVNLNGASAYSGNTDALSLVHGAPFASKFSNWTSAEFPTSTLSDPFEVSMTNTSLIGGGHWIAVDWIELELTAGSPAVPEPATLLLFGLGLFGIAGRIFIRRNK